MTVRALSFHADYACRHSGACCTARWPIRRETHPEPRVDLAISRFQDRVIAALPRRSAICHLDSESIPFSDDGCVFRDHEARRCRLHAEFGHDALPTACREFPRVTMLEPGVTKITLSCFCPTALAMLHESPDLPIEIVDRQSPIADELSGLDARASLPPAIRPDLLFDWPSWHEFERRAVALCNSEASLAEILAMLGEVADDVRGWKIGTIPLRDAVVRAFERVAVPIRQPRTAASSARAPAAPGDVAHNESLADRRFLSCHVFASWPAHIGLGLRTWLRSLETIVFLRDDGWTIRDIDLWVRHYAHPQRLVAAWNAAERS